MVDVEIGKLPAPLGDELDEQLQGRLLLRPVATPDRQERRLLLPGGRVGDEAEEVLEAAVVEERVALHVEEDVAV